MISPSTTAYEDSVAALLADRQRRFLFVLAGSDTSAAAGEFITPDFTLVSGPRAQPNQYQLRFDYFSILKEYVLVGDIDRVSVDVVLKSDSVATVLTSMPGRCMLTQWARTQRGWLALRSELLRGLDPDDEGACKVARRALAGTD